MKTLTKLLSCFALALALSPAMAAKSMPLLVGKVTKVTDGDTVHLTDTNGLRHKIRLQGIDAPELHQAFGQQSRDWLKNKISDHMVEVVRKGKDRYGRELGKILLNGKDLNLMSVQDGQSWWYRHYEKQQSPEDRVLYRQGEDDARLLHKGLWKDRNPTPPWEWRKAHSPHANSKSKAP